MNHKTALFNFVNTLGFPVSLRTKPHSFKTVELAMSKDIEAIPLLLVGSDAHNINWSQQNPETMAAVINHFLLTEIECQNSTKEIYERNPCFHWTDPEDNFSFDPKEYLGEEELVNYHIQAFCDNDPVKYQFVKNNYCRCEFMKLQAAASTSGIRAIKYQKYLEDKYKVK